MRKYETTIQDAIRVTLSQVGIVIRNNSGRFLTMYGAPVTIGTPGIADLTLFAEGGKTIFIEVKTPRGRQSDEQKRFQKRVRELGFEYVIMRDVEDAVKLCEKLKKLKDL